MATPKQAMMKVSLIDNSPTNPESRLRGIEELAASIKAAGGIYEPLVLQKAGRRYVIEDGHRRLAAAKLLEMEEVPYRLDTSKMKPAMVQLITGTQKEKLTPWETAQLVGGLLKEKVKQKEIAEAAGRSEAWVSKLKTIFEASKKSTTLTGEVVALVNGHMVPFGNFTNVDDLYDACQQILNPEKKAPARSSTAGSSAGSTSTSSSGSAPASSSAGPGAPAGKDSGKQIDMVDEAERIEFERLAAGFAELFKLPASSAELVRGKDEEVSVVLTFSSLKSIQKLTGGLQFEKMFQQLLKKEGLK